MRKFKEVRNSSKGVGNQLLESEFKKTQVENIVVPRLAYMNV